jgi:N-acetylneuraminic acid mutarotase
MLTEKIKKQIQEVYGQEIKYPRDCEGLAACIKEKTGNNISSSTLKRLYGFVRTSNNPSKYTLDTIAMYIGFSDWDSYEKLNYSEKEKVESTQPIIKGKISKKHNWLFIPFTFFCFVILWFICSIFSRSGDWKELEPMPEVRSGGRIIVDENSAYYIGGADAEFMQDNVWKYDFKTNKWKILKPMPTARAEFACTRVDNLIFCFGGYIGQKYGATNKVEVYDILNDRWQELPEMGESIISGRSILHGKDIYILGGSFGETKNTFLKYNTDSGDYTELPIFNTQRNQYTMSIVNEKIYVIGGMSFHKGEYLWHNNVDIYDIKTGIWSVGAEMPVKMARATGIVSGEEIHIIGGSIKYGDNSEGLKDTYYIYNISDNSWKENGNLPFKIRAAEGVLFDDNLFLFGGSTDFPNPCKNVKVK